MIVSTLLKSSLPLVHTTLLPINRFSRAKQTKLIAQGYSKVGIDFHAADWPSKTFIHYRFSSEKPPLNNVETNKQSNVSQNEQQSDPQINVNEQTKDEESQKKKSQNGQEQKFTAYEEALIKTYEPKQNLNVLMGLDPNHNFQKDLIVARHQYNRSTKQLRANILFEDLLKSETKIDIYDTKGKPYAHAVLALLFNFFMVLLTYWSADQYKASDPKNKVFLEKTKSGKLFSSVVIGLAYFFAISELLKYRKFQKRYVEKIFYNTQTQNFTMTKRKIWGKKYEQEVSRYKVVYTENKVLNSHGTNYFHLNTFDFYSIGYRSAWIKQDLWSHLIAQRVRL